jgi:hypothetical protein
LRPDGEPLVELWSCFRSLRTCDRQAHDSAINASLQSSAWTSALTNDEHTASETIKPLSPFIALRL